MVLPVPVLPVHTMTLRLTSGNFSAYALMRAYILPRCSACEPCTLAGSKSARVNPSGEMSHAMPSSFMKASLVHSHSLPSQMPLSPQRGQNTRGEKSSSV